MLGDLVYFAVPAAATVAAAIVWRAGRASRMIRHVVQEDDVLGALVETMPRVPADAASTIVTYRFFDQHSSRLLDEVILRGADADIALHTACCEVRTKWIQHLMHARVSVPEDTVACILKSAHGRMGQYERFSLHHADRVNEIAKLTRVVESAVRLGASVDRDDLYPPLYYAVHLRDAGLVQLLIDLGARVDGSCWWTGGPLDWAFETTDAGVVATVRRAMRSRECV